MTDWQLLERYKSEKSQAAFAQLVRRHIGWVRASALRQVRDAHRADDVAQAVFLALAQQAHRLHEGVALSTWLFQVTRYASSTALRAESRRRRNERRAAMTPRPDDRSSMTADEWEQLSEILDKLVARLRRDDQRAVLLRFYEQKSYPEMAAALGVSEEAARKRTDRAVERLRQLIGDRELTISAGALSAGLLAHVSGPASEALAAGAMELGSRAAGGAGGAVDTTTSVAAIAKGAIQMMHLMRLRLPLAACVALLLVTMIGVTMLDAGPKPSAATQAGPQPAAAAVPAPPAAETSPKAVVYAAFRAAAAGDAQGLIARFDRVTPAQAQTLTEVAQVMSAADRLSDAVAERFGVDVEQQFARALGTGVASFDVASAMETIRGDRATVELNAGPGDIELVRSGQTWKISSQALRTLNAGGVRQLRAGVPAIEQLTADVRAGKYKTIGELHQAAGRLMQAMRNRPATTRAATTAPSAGHTATPPPQNAAN